MGSACFCLCSSQSGEVDEVMSSPEPWGAGLAQVIPVWQKGDQLKMW